MKFNKISAGLSIALLGTVAAFATANKTAPGPYFYISAGGSSCQPYTPPYNCSVGGTDCFADANAPIPGAQLYLRPKTSPVNPLPCSQTLQLQPGF